MKRTFSKAYITSLQLRNRLETEGYFQNASKEKLSLLTYDNETTDETALFIKGDFAYVSSKTFEGLSSRAIVMVSKIMVELKLNNALWKFDQRNNARDSRIITELRRKEILFKTDVAYIHYVNPFLIRKGKIGNVVFRMAKLLENSASVTTDHIRKLQWGGKVTIKAIDYVTLT